MKKVKSFISGVVSLAMCASLITGTGMSAAATEKGENLYKNPGMEDTNLAYNIGGQLIMDGSCWKGQELGDIVVNTDIAKSGSRSISYINDYRAVPYQNVNIEAGKTYIAAYNVRSEKEINKGTGYNHWFQSKTAGATLNGCMYLNGNNLASITNAGSGGISCASDDMQVGTEWENVQIIFSQDKAGASPWFGYFGWSSTSDKFLVDDMFLGELTASTTVTDNDGQGSGMIVVGSNAESFKLSAKTLNQLGTTAGLENVTYRWSTNSDKITVGNDGTVTLANDTESGKYEVIATADSIVGETVGIYEIYVVIEGTVTSIDFSGNGFEPLAFEESVKEYTVNIPVIYQASTESFTYEIPTATASIIGNKYSVDVTNATSVDDKTIIRIMDNEEEKDRYTISFNLIGQNKYKNPGMEDASLAYDLGDGQLTMDGSCWKGQELGSIVVNTDIAKSGSRSISYINDYRAVPYQNVNIEAGKTYIAAYNVRSEKEINKGTGYNHWFQSKTDGAKLDGRMYINGDTPESIIFGENEGIYISCDDDMQVGTEWEDVQIVFSQDKAGASPWFGYFNWTATPDKFLVDDMFLGEIVIADINAGKSVINTSSGAINEKVDVKALNQLLTGAGLEDKVDIEILDSTVTGGVNFDKNTCIVTADQGASGTLTITAKATVDESKWANAPQKEFTDTFTIYFEGNNKFIVFDSAKDFEFAVNYKNNSGSDENLVLFCGVYNDNKLERIERTEFVLKSGELFNTNRFVIKGADGKLVKVFLWKNDGSLMPVLGAESNE